MCTERPDN